MGPQGTVTRGKGNLQASQEIGSRQAPQRAGRGRDRHIEMSGKFWLPAHI
jgi:hypothetical protein